MSRRGGSAGRPRLDNRGVDFVCLPWSLANHRVLGVSGEACVIRPNVAALAEAAAAQNNQERRYDEQSFHCFYPNLPRPRFMVDRLA
jgi:hypothetical protein